jgi:4-amino-4-deoxy-L-arabinose transferase-like glycosyltransferase
MLKDKCLTPFPLEFGLGLGLFLIETYLVIKMTIPWLIGQVNADDYYYYLVLARNSAAGFGPTFDGIELTNGFHPLYLLLLTFLAKLSIGGSEFLIKAGLILLLFFHNATGVALGAGFRHRQRPDIGTLTALIWLLNPWPLAITLNGVETPIATFLWTLIIFTFSVYRQQTQFDLKKTLILGILVGLAILARTDGLLLLGALVVTELYRARRNGPDWVRFIAGTGFISCTAFIVTLPWWWWSWQSFGTIMQVSGKAIFLGTHGFDWLNSQLILSNVAFVGRDYLARMILFTLLPLLALGFAAWQCRYTPHPGRLKFKELLSEFDFAWLAIVALALWYSGWQWSVQNWYLLPTILVVTLGVGLAWEQLLLERNVPVIKPAGGLIAFTGTLILIAVYGTIGFGFPNQERGYYLAQWFNQNTEPEAVIGAWNSGVIGYFTERKVVNLDGVVNNSIYDYKLARQATNVFDLMDYFNSRHISYLTDYEHFYIEAPQEIGLQLVYESPDQAVRIYRIDRDEH